MTARLLTDRPALLRHRARATDDALFLHRLAVHQVQERLSEVNRRFTAPAIVTGFPRIWAGAMPMANIVRDDDTLDLTPGAHDLVIHAMALHWANDPVGQLIQCRRALRSDGLLLAMCLGGRTLADLRAALAKAEVEITGGLSPRILPMAEIRDWGALLQRAGLALAVADTVTQTVTYAEPLALMHDLRAMGETNALADRLRRPTGRRVFTRAAALYPVRDDRVAATFEMIFLTGWAPHPDQQQPLRPGSAVTRLADALKPRGH